MKTSLFSSLLLIFSCAGAQKPPEPPHSVELNWKAPNSPVSYYQVFRSTNKEQCDGGKPYADHVPVPHFLDKQVEAGKTYYYCVVSVKAEKKGFQRSAPTQQIKATVPKP